MNMKVIKDMLASSDNKKELFDDIVYEIAKLDIQNLIKRKKLGMIVNGIAEKIDDDEYEEYEDYVGKC